MIRIAIQSKGRLSDSSIEFLRSKGLEFEPNGRSLVTRCANRDIEILWLRSGDIPEYVSRGVADFGIAGANVLAEKGMEFKDSEKLDFAFCKLVIAVPNASGIRSLQDLEGERIATSYPAILSRYLQTQNIRAAIIPLRGSVEIAPQLNLADAICDLVQSGQTLKENHLKPLVTVMESQAVLIRSPFISQSFFNTRPAKELFFLAAELVDPEVSGSPQTVLAAKKTVPLSAPTFYDQNL